MEVHSTADIVIELDHRWRGSQPRAYGPHRYETVVTITGQKSWDGLTEDQVRKLVKVFVPDWEVEERTFVSPRLVELVKLTERALSKERLGPQQEVWRIVVEVPFTD